VSFELIVLRHPFHALYLELNREGLELEKIAKDRIQAWIRGSVEVKLSMEQRRYLETFFEEKFLDQPVLPSPQSPILGNRYSTSLMKEKEIQQAKSAPNLTFDSIKDSSRIVNLAEEDDVIDDRRKCVLFIFFSLNLIRTTGIVYWDGDDDDTNSWLDDEIELTKPKQESYVLIESNQKQYLSKNQAE